MPRIVKYWASFRTWLSAKEDAHAKAQTRACRSSLPAGAGCHDGKPDRMSHASAHAHGVAYVPPEEGKDPVCGVTARPDSPHQATHDSRVIRFCSAKCLAKFEGEQRYLRTANEPAPDAATPAGAASPAPVGSRSPPCATCART